MNQHVKGCMVVILDLKSVQKTNHLLLIIAALYGAVLLITYVTREALNGSVRGGIMRLIRLRKSSTSRSKMLANYLK